MNKSKIIKQIAKTSDIIRRKHQALKRGKMDSQYALEERLEPIVAPLRQLVKSSPNVHEELDKYKQENNKHEEYTNDEDVNDKDEDITAVSHYVSRGKKRRATDPVYASTPRSASIARRYATAKRSRQLFNTIDEDASPSTSQEKSVEVTPTNSFEMSIREAMEDETAPAVAEALENLGPLSRRYVKLLITDKNNEMDTVFGVHFVGEKLVIGDSEFDVDENDKLLIKGVNYAGTRGIFELIFKKIPDEDLITDADRHKYRQILLSTNAYKRNYSSSAPNMGNRGYKYKHVIAPLLFPNRVSGKGMIHGRGQQLLPMEMRVSGNAIDYVHWDNPNELVDRLRLLVSSRDAGHTGHGNEIMSIVEELREAGYIV